MIIKIIRLPFLTLIIFLRFSINMVFGQLNGSMRYEPLPSEFGRTTSENPCVRIKSRIPNLNFNRSSGNPNVRKEGEDYIITLTPGAYQLIVDAQNFESLDIALDLRKYEVQTYQIIPIIDQFYLEVETRPTHALVILTDSSGKEIKQFSPFKHNPLNGQYNLKISAPNYQKIDTNFVFENEPITKLKFVLDRIKSIDSKKLGIKIFQGESELKLKETDILRIQEQIISYYKQSDKFLLVNGDYDSLKKNKKVDYAILFETLLLFENQSFSDSSMVQFTISLDSLYKNCKQSVQFCNNLNICINTKIDSGLTVIEKAIESCERPVTSIANLIKFIRSEKGLAAIGSAIISAGIITDAIFNQTKREKLPDAPPFPNRRK